MSKIYINGTYQEADDVSISHRDSGFTTGNGIFDSMLVKDGTAIHAREHYERIIHDVGIVIGIDPDFSFEEFEKIYKMLLEKNNIQEGYARIRTTITGGVVDAPLDPVNTPTILMGAAATDNPNDITPVTAAIITDFPRIAGCILENCKRSDYSRSYAARREAEKIGAVEAILTNTDGNIACGATSNIFIEENGNLITPPLSDGVLAGVTRRKLIEERQKNQEVREESISIERLKSADKIFLTNSFIGLRPVTLLTIYVAANTN